MDPTSVISGTYQAAVFIHDHCSPKRLLAQSGKQLTQTAKDLREIQDIMEPHLLNQHLEDRDRLSAEIQYLNDIREKKGRMHDIKLISAARRLSKDTQALADRVETTSGNAFSENIHSRIRRNTTPATMTPGKRDVRPPNTKSATAPDTVMMSTSHGPDPTMPEAVLTGMHHAYYAEPGEYTNSPPVSPPPQYSYQNPSHSNIYSPTQSPPAFPSPQSETPKFPEPDYGTSPQYTSTYTYQQHSCPDCEQATYDANYDPEMPQPFMGSYGAYQ